MHVIEFSLLLYYRTQQIIDRKIEAYTAKKIWFIDCLYISQKIKIQTQIICVFISYYSKWKNWAFISISFQEFVNITKNKYDILKKKVFFKKLKILQTFKKNRKCFFSKPYVTYLHCLISLSHFCFEEIKPFSKTVYN